MATDFFLTDAASDVDNPFGLEKVAAIGVRGGGVDVSTTVSVSGPVGAGGVGCTNNTTNNVELLWWSPPLNAVTISGTVTFNVWMAESNMAANVGAQVKVFRCDSAGAEISTIVNSEKGTEVPVTTREAQNWTAVPTSTSLSAGDRLKIIVAGNDGGGDMNSGHTFTLGYDGDSSAADGDSFVRFTETLTEYSPAVTKRANSTRVVIQAVHRAATWFSSLKRRLSVNLRVA